MSERYRLHRGEALAWLQSLPDACADALITDPPYSSGGFTRGDRNLPANDKYARSDAVIQRHDFAGDNRDSRSFCMWASLWLSEALRACKPGAVALVFCDWRQLPMMTDAVQCGGWVWRGLVAWDKGDGARSPHVGYFRHQCEYVVFGSAGPLPQAEHAWDQAGCIRVVVRQDDKHHTTGKPTELMRRLVRRVAPGGLILDPFAGSATTLVAALLEGRRAWGCEISADYHAIGERRCAEAAGAGPLFEPEQTALFEAAS